MPYNEWYRCIPEARPRPYGLASPSDTNKKPTHTVNIADMLSPMTAASFLLLLTWAIPAYVLVRIGFWPLRDSMKYKRNGKTQFCVLETVFAMTAILYVVMMLAGICRLVPESGAEGFVRTCILILICFIVDRLRALRSVSRSGRGFYDEGPPFQTAGTGNPSYDQCPASRPHPIRSR